MNSMDPDPDKTPDLEPGGGVAPGSTPPESAQTSGLSAPEPRTSRHFPPTGVAAIVVAVLFVALFLAVAVGLVLAM
ncbi:DUF6480 family protein [Nocardia rhizosphaerihabitans]|uniref:Uncharacterized protein n=1 Tax=Nocardia rhizosphaerihabitans TaxID=1691570 RepID=A0ABQ2KIH3_9NOCA|nr:DUF6480 family protein [Nocardia rhizosphaerihabitans]GGN82899.1 hypothetical protein GCM10011610_34800 [Nocardia rhizosphaerihabitans]